MTRATPQCSAITVAISGFGGIVRLGLIAAIAGAPRIRVISPDPPLHDMTTMLVQFRPTALLVDDATLADPGMLRRAREIAPTTALIVITVGLEQARALTLLAHGASACLDQGVSPAEVRDAIDSAVAGSQLIVLSRHTGSRDPCRVRIEPSPLTAREHQVRNYLSLGHSNAEIALALSISVETVRTHATHIYRKLGLRNRTQLIAARPE